MGILSSAVSAVATGGASLWAKATPYLAGALVIGALVAWGLVERAEMATAKANQAAEEQKLAEYADATKAAIATIAQLQTSISANAAAEAAVQASTATRVAAELPARKAAREDLKCALTPATVQGQDAPTAPVLLQALAAIGGAK